MTRYEVLIDSADKCTRIAAGSSNIDMRLFYQNAAEGYRRKAEKLTIEEAEELA